MKKIITLLMLLLFVSCSGTIEHFNKLDQEMKLAQDECIQGKRMDCWGDPAGGGPGGGDGPSGGK